MTTTGTSAKDILVSLVSSTMNDMASDIVKELFLSTIKNLNVDQLALLLKDLTSTPKELLKSDVAPAPTPVVALAPVSAPVVETKSDNVANVTETTETKTFASVASVTVASASTPERERSPSVSSSSVSTSSNQKKETITKRTWKDGWIQGCAKQYDKDTFQIIHSGDKFCQSILGYGVPEWMLHYYFFVSNYRPILDNNKEEVIPKLYVRFPNKGFEESCDAVFEKYNKNIKYDGTDNETNKIIRQYFNLVFANDFSYQKEFFFDNIHPNQIAKKNGEEEDYFRHKPVILSIELGKISKYISSSQKK